PQALPNTRFVLLGDLAVLEQRAQLLGLDVTLAEWQPGAPLPKGSTPVWHCPAGVSVTPGQPDPATAASTLTMLSRAIDGCLESTFNAIVKAHLVKSVIGDGADPHFTGDTEYLAARSNTERVVMMLSTEGLRVALATTHLPLRNVADAITQESLTTTLRILHTDLRQRFHIERSEEHTSELQSRFDLVCRLLL